MTYTLDIDNYPQTISLVFINVHLIETFAILPQYHYIFYIFPNFMYFLLLSLYFLLCFYCKPALQQYGVIKKKVPVYPSFLLNFNFLLLSVFSKLYKLFAFIHNKIHWTHDILQNDTSAHKSLCFIHFKNTQID